MILLDHPAYPVRPATDVEEHYSPLFLIYRQDTINEKLPTDPDRIENPPMNPMGRTGYIGRGLLRRYGANHVVMVVYLNGNKVAAKFNEELGYKVDMFVPHPAITDIASQLKNNVREAGKHLEGEQKQLLDDYINSQINVRYEGYMNDARNTDNAWIDVKCVVSDVSSHPFMVQAINHLNYHWIDISNVRLHKGQQQIIEKIVS